MKPGNILLDEHGRDEGDLHVATGHCDVACELALRAANAVPAEASGLLDDASRHLESSKAAGWSDWAQLASDPDLLALHGDPRWKALPPR